MAKEILYNDISELLAIIREQYSVISIYKGKIPQIELDIIMANIRRLYEDFFELNRMNQHTGTEPMMERQKESVKIIEKADDKIPEPPESPEIADSIIVNKEESEKTQFSEEMPIKTVKKNPHKKTPVTDLFTGTESTPLAEKFRDDKKSLLDKIVSEKKDKTLADNIQNPIRDLRTGIGVNDRFLFINELFKGNMNEYAVAIEEINSQDSLDDAVQKISILKDTNKWDEKSESYIRLLGFVNRRFS